MKNFFIGAVVTTMMIVPVQGVVFAADTVPSGSNSGNSVPSGSNPTDNVPSGANPGSGSGGTVKLTNPLSSSENYNLTDFLKSVIAIILVFAIPIIVLFIMYAGFLFVTARGEPAQIQKARAALTWAVIGGVIVLGAWAILEVIQGTITAITK
ncbi:hypothetical protein GW943_01030 [Candidatus Parcubacteria bacterium]|uniref:Uncharacterized protein n=1 Tax=Candidatus Kaiserbacteria bacterium CG10_big_fil_rev_8_21_14_0_10_47_16 TaxID=1974608 RepID=A0A2H0UDE5_9BACT|nr:hypothetical protein [Candidatus Parcubacteria bacterium]PIR84411.1 MAG: hypothetical protein COU16_02410 [Candidatus Kaiserbacteria bacterium CG10_big_fil_rev_8_21_14_0_10_47_16]